MITPHIMLKRFRNVKTLPNVIMKISRLISDENSTIQEIEEVIKLDPTLVMRLLRIVNSPYYGICQKVESIAKAVVFIGLKNLRTLIVMEGLKDLFKDNHQSTVFSRTKLWLHSAAVGICARMISERIFQEKGDDAFLAGILHDIGMIVEDQVVQDLFLQACSAYRPGVKSITEYENEIIGTHHCEVGYLLASEWNLPYEIQDAIKNHHTLLREESSSRLAKIIQTAGCIVTKIGYPAIQGIEEKLSPSLVPGINNMADEYRTLIKDLPDEIEKAKELYETQAEGI
ncbi:MAG: HDOD domain-containing protein [bacterium]